MKLSRILFFIGIFVFVSNVTFAQYDDDDNSQSRKGSARKEKSAPRVKSGAKQSKTREDLFRSSVNKSTYLSKKEQQKLINKKQKNKSKHYKKTRGELNNKSTIKRMKKSERHSYQINSGKNAPFFQRMVKTLNPTNDKIKRKSSRKSNKLQKRQDDARDKYAKKEYTPTSSKKKKKKTKIRTFYNPLGGLFK